MAVNCSLFSVLKWTHVVVLVLIILYVLVWFIKVGILDIHDIEPVENNDQIKLAVKIVSSIGATGMVALYSTAIYGELSTALGS